VRDAKSSLLRQRLSTVSCSVDWGEARDRYFLKRLRLEKKRTGEAKTLCECAVVYFEVVKPP
jgi:hypothetical protein